MPNGKGWLDCFDCIYHKRDYGNQKSQCLKYNYNLPDQKEINFKHRFCSNFSPNKEAVIVLNGDIRKVNGKMYYYVYKPESDFYHLQDYKKIELKKNILYGYEYPTPEKINKIMDLVQ